MKYFLLNFAYFSFIFRFMKISKGKNFITLSQFRESMGFLGLDSIGFTSEKIFNYLDKDRDGKVKKKK
jgi:hypothetical protein